MKTMTAIPIAIALATPAAAQTAIGLTGDRTLAMIDTATATVTGTLEVAGTDRLLGIDMRPSDGKLYAVTADHRIVTVDTTSGALTEVARMDVMLPVGDMPVIVDFNPAADKLRFMTGTVNHRVDPGTGKVTVDGPLAYEPGDMHAGETPMIVAAAYSNSHGKPEKTAMYDIDATIVALIRQTVPNDGTLKAVGKLGIDPAASYAFDIATTADGAHTAWLAADTMLHTVDLETGKVSASWPLTGATGALRDLTVMPAM
ncbi:MAG: DUF4394 domain-containing protein [Pseudomonadota bacterium]